MTPDLSLIPMEDLIKEVESRCNEFICAFTPNGFQTKQETLKNIEELR